MQYSVAQIANMALGRVGARGEITDINEGSPNAKKILNVWDAIFQEVLSERDWKFAKTRVELQLSTTVPIYAYRHAWVLPGDLLRFVRPHKRPPDTNWYAWMWGPEGYGWYNRSDPPFSPCGWPYVCEAVATGQDSQGNPTYEQCALTDYDGSIGNARINYIRLLTDYTKLMPGFVNCLAFRLAQEVAVSITEDMQKMQAMESLYRESLNSAEAQNETVDFQKDETGSETWVRAGRYIRYW